MIRTIGVLFAAAWFSTGTVAAAQEGVPPEEEPTSTAAPEDERADGPESDQEAEARIQFEQGREFYNQGAFEKAAIALRRAFELRPSYRILYYLGWAESETGNYHRAVTAFDTYLKEARGEDTPERIKEIEAEVKRLSARVGYLSVNGGTEGAKVKVDNETRGALPLEAPIPVNIGRHEVTIVDGADTLLTEVIRMAGGQEISLTVPDRQTEAAAAAPPPVPEEPSAPPEDEPKPKRVWTFVTYGVAAATGVAAAVTGAMALTRQNNVWDQCDSDGNCYSEDYDGDFTEDTDRIKTLALTTDILIGTAALFAIAGTVLVFVEPSFYKESSANAGSPHLMLGPGSVGVQGRF